MSVIGIDPSLASTGVAIIDSQVEDVEVVTLGRKGRESDGWVERSDRIVAQVRRIAANVPRSCVDLVVIEAMPPGMKPQPWLGDRWALWFGLYSTLRGRGYPIAVVNPSSRAVWATGRGRAKKPEVLAAVREQWPAVRIHDDNQADALTLAAMGAHHLGWPLPFEIKDRHSTGLQAIEWPEVAA